jgi:hypothetical protein
MTEETGRKSFLGVRVEGEINEGEKRANQRPLWELEPLLRAVIDDPEIHSFGWQQYTPYFNDGEPCVFRVYDPWFVTNADAATLTIDSDGYIHDFEQDEYQVSYSDHPSLGQQAWTWSGHWPDRVKVYGEYTGTNKACYERCRALSDAFDSDAFDDVLLTAFGDHCKVTFSRAKMTFVVDSYEHD